MPEDSARTKRPPVSGRPSYEDGGPDPLVGEVLNDRFEVVAPLARGGMGKVYRAIQRPLGRPVALKVLDVRGVASTRADFQRRFFLEAATAAKLTHPNTVVVYDYGLAGQDVFFIAMELIDGRTLAQTLREQGPLDAARVAHIGRQICGSLAEAHAQGVVHRDLKPSNVLLTKRGADVDYVKVLDFGLVKIVGDDDDHENTASGVMMGTPRYMSPEQVTGRDVTARSDVYSLGTVLFHALTGKPPFDGESKFDIFTHHVSSAPRTLREVYPLYAAPPRLERVVMRCLAKSPSDRWGSMEEVDRELAEVLRELRANPAAFGVSSLVSTMPHLPSRPALTAPTEVRVVTPAPAQEIPQAPPVSQERFAEAIPDAPPPHGTTFMMPKEPRIVQPARAFPYTLLAILVVTVGGGGAYWWMFARDGKADPLGLVRSEATHTSPLEGSPTVGLPVIDPHTPIAVTSGPPPVIIQCTQPHVRMQRDGRDLGDCGAPLPIPAGTNWTIDLSAPGYDPRTITLFSAEGIVPVTLTTTQHRPANSGAHGGGSAAHTTHHGGSDVRDPWQ